MPHGSLGAVGALGEALASGARGGSSEAEGAGAVEGRVRRSAHSSKTSHTPWGAPAAKERPRPPTVRTPTATQARSPPRSRGAFGSQRGCVSNKARRGVCVRVCGVCGVCV